MKPGMGLTCGSVLLAVLSLPLALGWVRPNRFYGLRPAGRPADPTAWGSLNAFAGRAFLAVAAAGLLLTRVPAFLSAERQVGFFLFLLLGAGLVVGLRARMGEPGV